MWEASEDRCSIYMGGSATTLIKELHHGKTGPKTRQDLAPNLVGYLSRWLLLASGALPRWTAARKAERRKSMSSEHFGQLAWQFKRMSGSSGLKVQAAIAC